MNHRFIGNKKLVMPNFQSIPGCHLLLFSLSGNISPMSGKQMADSGPES